ncbi:hypothetical protein [Burkholderia ambifaria]|uniref:hypothetical protein n=1 Tax=Burkholderia ambifaria TaxID=152480 RepID=UPI001589B641|nr:hypothetical protein [Burkholderia ambifaria]
MGIDIATHASWADLQQLRWHIVDGTQTTGVMHVKKLLMKALADAIAAEDWRRGVDDSGAVDNKLIVTVDLRIGPWARQSSGPEMARSGISLIAQLDDVLAEKKKSGKALLSW